MAGGVGEFVKKNNQGVDYSGPRDLDRRREDAESYKIVHKANFGVFAKQAAPLQRRDNFNSTLPLITSHRYESNQDDPFGGSDLDESGETTTTDMNIGPSQKTHSIQHGQLAHTSKHDLDLGSYYSQTHPRGDDEEEEIKTEERLTEDRKYTVQDGRDYGNAGLPNSGFFAAGMAAAGITQGTFQSLKNQVSLSGSQRPREQTPKWDQGTRHNRGISDRFTSTTPASLAGPTPFAGQDTFDPESGVERRLPKSSQYQDPLSPDQRSIDNEHIEDQQTPRPGTSNQIGRDQMIGEMINEDTPQTRNRYDGTNSEESTTQSSPSRDTHIAENYGEESAVGLSGTNKRSAVELDYDDSALSGMTYTQLQDQPFDDDPKSSKSIVPEELKGPGVSLNDRLQHFAGHSPEDQDRLFGEMLMEDWEESGDWFMDRFSEIMAKLKDARKARREISRAFEEELAGREGAVRGKADGIQEVMRQMRAGGEGVLGVRTP